MNMRFAIRLIVLGFAGFGIYKTWEMLEPKVSEVRERAVGARDKIEPAIREAADTLQSATKDAAEELADPTPVAAVSSLSSSAAEHIAPAPRMAT
jgi:hypothetical protein